MVRKDAWSFFKLLDEDAGGAVEIEECPAEYQRLFEGSSRRDSGSGGISTSILVPTSVRFRWTVGARHSVTNSSTRRHVSAQARDGPFLAAGAIADWQERCRM